MLNVSVILPSHNSEKWVAEAVRSVLKQTHQALQLIVIDDSSSDNTVEIVRSLADDPRLSLIQRKRCSGGPATPRNDGIDVATGDYLAFIDSDDLWHPRKLELQLKAMQTHGLNFLSTLHISFRRVVPSAQIFDQCQLQIQCKDHQQLISKNWVVTSSALISRSLFGELAFDQSADYIGVEDYLLWLQLHQRKDIRSAVLIAPLVFYRLRNDSISSSKRAMAGKIFYLLSHYRYLGKPLGFSKYYFFMSYAVSSLLTRLTHTLR
ncbi:MAG: teichuronic acid biosynthesis glycosyltransferase TuaG [Arenicella sp.]|jgi:teichuronic acid biosynthesis glycosyltransferase TuaG